MFRNVATLILGMGALVSLHAGYIEVGSINGLTNSGEITASSNATTGTFGETTYGNSLLEYTTTSTAPTKSALTASNGVTFNLINYGSTTPGSPVDELWAGTTAAGTVASPLTTTFTIPIGVFGVTSVDTMLNDAYGVIGAGDTTVTFNFGSSATNITNTLTFDLVNGQTIRDSQNCTGGTGLAACQSQKYATTLTGSSYAATSYTGSTADKTASVAASNVWSGTYTNTNSTGPYANTTGTLYLDQQDFSLGTYSNLELYSIVISDTQTGSDLSRDELSAMAYQTGVPEPTTIMLVLTGIGVMLVGRRRSQNSSGRQQA